MVVFRIEAVRGVSKLGRIRVGLWKIAIERVERHKQSFSDTPSTFHHSQRSGRHNELLHSGNGSSYIGSDSV